MLELDTEPSARFVPASAVGRADPARVPFEFIGPARVFRDKVKVVDTAMDEALVVITAPLRARLKRHHKLRTEMLADTTRRYNALVPAEFRIGEVEGTKHKTEFAIVETRLSASLLHCIAWVDPEIREPGVTICKFTFSVHKGRLQRRWTPTCNVSITRSVVGLKDTGGPLTRPWSTISRYSLLPVMTATRSQPRAVAGSAR